jgi:hypothetical protein
MRSFIPSFVVAGFASLALTLVGCGAAPAETSESESAAEALSSLGQSIVGSYARTDGSGAPDDITFYDDGTYTADTVVYCVAAPCPPIASGGKWSTTGSGSTGTLRLAPRGGTAVSYKLSVAKSGGQITLARADGSGLVEHMHRTDLPELCGGIAALPCPSAKTCVYDYPPAHADPTGLCYARGARGTMCGGIAGFQCNPGLTCVISDPNISDASGICREPGDEGMPCGGIAGLPCNAGLTCKIASTGTSDAMGVCSR